jgi:HEPN domain-containing protein
MNPIVAEWIEKAEGDFATMERELRARKRPNYDAACFHAQQCVEKYLKARLTAAGISFGKTHDLVSLLDGVLPAQPLWEPFKESLAFLSECAVAVRYPGESADKEMARQAAIRCRAFRRFARQSIDFGLGTAG